MPQSMVDGHTAWDEGGNAYERRGMTNDFADAARQVKRGARVGTWLAVEGIDWLPEAPDAARKSARVAREWLEFELREWHPITFTKWRDPDSDRILLLAQWDC